jgi:tRNA pseudouridine32 synthase/23S rRNA pseudouridine746 synthase
MMNETDGKKVSVDQSDRGQAQEHHLPIVDDEGSAVELLASASGLSRQRLRQVMDQGAVWLTHGTRTRRIRRRKTRLQRGDTLHLYYNPAVLAEPVRPAGLIADRGRYSVWDKPYGMRSQGSRWGDHTTLLRWAEKQLRPQRSGWIVHRLDRAASGLILLAHDKRMAAALSALFRERQVDKRYQVLVHGRFPVADSPLIIDADVGERSARSRASLRHYDADSDRSELEVGIDTGRKHQIRVHLAALGFPVVGDRLYGAAGDVEDLQLRAVYLGFPCPISGERQEFRL